MLEELEGQGQAMGMPFEALPTELGFAEAFPAASAYFFMELPDARRYVHEIRGKFPLGFGRRVLASPRLLNMAHRADWRACTMTRAEEDAMTSTMRDRFKPFDIAPNDDDDDDDDDDDPGA